MEDAADEVCARCAPRPPDAAELAGVVDVVDVTTLSAALVEALVGAVRCLAHDGVTIDRAHVEAVHRALGRCAEPLEPWLATRAIAARPELAGASLLVAPSDATLVHPAENWRKRLDRLVALAAPDEIIDEARAELARAEARTVPLAWDQVMAWPAPAAFPGTIGVAVIARTLARLALPPLLGDAAAELAAIDAVAAGLVLDATALAQRHALSAAASAATEPRRAHGLELAVRFLDELGHSGLRDNQDTLVDDCYFTLRHVALVDLAARVYRTWLVDGVPAALGAIATR